MEIGVDIDISKYNNDLKNIPTELGGHQRNIVKIDYDKYNIHGIYVVDATWDNSITKDLYNNSTSTFDKRKEYRKLEKLTNEDLLLDFHNFDEYLEKINHYLKRSIYKRDPFIINNGSHQAKIIRSYLEIYEDIMKILYKLDYSKYQELYNKYNDYIKNTKKLFNKIRYDNKTDISIKEIEDIFSDFLTNYATYIIRLSNQTVNTETILLAASNINKQINNYSQEELDIWINQTIKDNIIQQNKSFPYTYDPNNPRPNYLESPNEESSKTK